MSDYYEILGVARNANKDDIKKPIANWRTSTIPTNPAATTRSSKELNEAYEILYDDKKRAEYDTYGKLSGATAAAGGRFRPRIRRF